MANAIFIYGPIAVGKLTVAEILKEKLGYKLAHNHALTDFVDEVFERGAQERDKVIEKFRYEFLEEVAKAKVNLIVTHCYYDDFVSVTGLSDPKYVSDIEEIFIKNGVNFYPVHLKASNEELLHRVDAESRKNFKKLKDRKIMEELLEEKDWDTSPDLKNNFVIDNTNISPEKVADMIIEHFELR